MTNTCVQSRSTPSMQALWTAKTASDMFNRSSHNINHTKHQQLAAFIYGVPWSRLISQSEEALHRYLHRIDKDDSEQQERARLGNRHPSEQLAPHTPLLPPSSVLPPCPLPSREMIQSPRSPQRHICAPNFVPPLGVQRRKARGLKCMGIDYFSLSLSGISTDRNNNTQQWEDTGIPLDSTLPLGIALRSSLHPSPLFFPFRAVHSFYRSTSPAGLEKIIS